MRKKVFSSIIFIMSCSIAAAGCEDDSLEDDQSNSSESDNKAGGDADGDGDMEGEEDNEDDSRVCEKLETSLEEVATRVMILEDKSLSMSDNNKWDLALSAIDSMLTGFDSKIFFGLDLFNISDESGGIGQLNPFGNRGDAQCAVGDSVVLDVALNNKDQIQQTLSGYSPSNATPLYLAMSNYTDRNYAARFLDGTASSYLLIISDGMDTCGVDGVFNRNGGQGVSAQSLAMLTEELKKDMGVKTIVIGFGDGIDPDQLDAIAKAGGTEFTEYFNAADGDDLAQALNTIAQAVVVSCQFQLGDIDRQGLNLDLTNVFLDDEPVPRDDNCKKNTGWTWTDSNRTTIEFCKETCKRIKNKKVTDFRLEIACSEDDVYMV